MQITPTFRQISKSTRVTTSYANGLPSNSLAGLSVIQSQNKDLEALRRRHCQGAASSVKACPPPFRSRPPFTLQQAQLECLQSCVLPQALSTRKPPVPQEDPSPEEILPLGAAWLVKAAGIPRRL